MSRRHHGRSRHPRAHDEQSRPQGGNESRTNAGGPGVQRPRDPSPERARAEGHGADSRRPPFSVEIPKPPTPGPAHGHATPNGGAAVNGHDRTNGHAPTNGHPGPDGHGPINGHQLRNGVPAPNGHGPVNGQGSNGAPHLNGGPEHHGDPNGIRSGCTAPQLRRFIKSRPYVPMHELRRRFGINGAEDDVTPLAIVDGRVYVGLPEHECRLLAELVRGGEVGYELSLDPRTPIVVGVYPMRPVPRA